MFDRMPLMNDTDYQLMSDKANDMRLARMSAAQPFNPAAFRPATQTRPASSPAVGDQIYSQYFPGQTPQKEHIIWPMVHSLTTGGLICFAGGSFALALNYMGLIEVAYRDVFAVSALFVLPVALLDWVEIDINMKWFSWQWAGKSRIMTTQTADEWIDPTPIPVMLEAPPETPSALIKIGNVENKDPIPYDVVQLLPSGWKWSKFRKVCKAVKDSGKFSEKGSGESKDIFTQFRDSFFAFQAIDGRELIWWIDPENSRRGLDFSRDCKNILGWVARDSELAQQMKERGF